MTPASARCVAIISGRFGQPVDDEPADRREQAREREHEEDEAGGAVRPGEHLRPDARGR